VGKTLPEAGPDRAQSLRTMLDELQRLQATAEELNARIRRELAVHEQEYSQPKPRRRDR
jgi:hypothetical protein